MSGALLISLLLCAPASSLSPVPEPMTLSELIAFTMGNGDGDRLSNLMAEHLGIPEASPLMRKIRDGSDVDRLSNLMVWHHIPEASPLMRKIHDGKEHSFSVLYNSYPGPYKPHSLILTVERSGLQKGVRALDVTTYLADLNGDLKSAVRRYGPRNKPLHETIPVNADSKEQLHAELEFHKWTAFAFSRSSAPYASVEHWRPRSLDDLIALAMREGNRISLAATTAKKLGLGHDPIPQRILRYKQSILPDRKERSFGVLYHTVKEKEIPSHLLLTSGSPEKDANSTHVEAILYLADLKGNLKRAFMAHGPAATSRREALSVDKAAQKKFAAELEFHQSAPWLGLK